MMKLPKIPLWALVVVVGTAALGCGKPESSATVAPSVAPLVALTVTLRLATTTSVNDSGLLAALLPEFEKEIGVRVTVAAVGTGAAFKLARDGNADLLLVHDRAGEDDFIATGDGADRIELMWNTFEILGPADDPAKVRGCASGEDAMRRIADARASFVSRGDDSGTHRRETALLNKALVPTPDWEGRAEVWIQGLHHGAPDPVLLKTRHDRRTGGRVSAFWTPRPDLQLFVEVESERGQSSLAEFEYRRATASLGATLAF